MVAEPGTSTKVSGDARVKMEAVSGDREAETKVAVKTEAEWRGQSRVEKSKATVKRAGERKQAGVCSGEVREGECSR